MDLRISELIAMQKELQALYAGKWLPCVPENGLRQLLWGIGEIGEVIDIMKKRGAPMIMTDAETRAHLTEEMSDFVMYYADVMLCFGISEAEYSNAFFEKHMRVRKRDFDEKNRHMFDGQAYRQEYTPFPKEIEDECRERFHADDLHVSDILEMQHVLHEIHPGWERCVPSVGNNEMLWTIGEISEVIDIIKKRGHDEIMNEPETRAHFLEEMCDVMMHFANVMHCFGITAEEYSEAHFKKHVRNMHRDYVTECRHMFDRK